MEIFKQIKIPCSKGEAVAEIMAKGKVGYATNVCPACYFYSNSELDAHSEGTAIERGVAVARLGQRIEIESGNPIVADCTPLSKEVAKEIDPEIVRQLSSIFKHLPSLLLGKD